MYALCAGTDGEIEDWAARIACTILMNQPEPARSVPQTKILQAFRTV